MKNELIKQLIREVHDKNLTELDLSKNQLTQLPLEILELKNLKILNLSKNKLTQLPPEIKELTSLETLNLSKNKLTQLPPEIKELISLEKLDVGLNQLTQLPPEIKELQNLKTLTLSKNKLTQLPPEIKELTSLETLNLSKNKLTRLPPEIKELKNLTDLYLKENYLTELQPEIKELQNLKRLNLSNNKLTQLPPEVGKLKDLERLDLSWNQLAQLPSEIGELKNLTVLYLDGSVLTELPSEISKLQNLIRLNLCKNNLTELPSEIGELGNLTDLILYENQLTKLPAEISKLKNLTELNLYGNPLTSPPPEIVSRGIDAILTYLKNSKITERSEAKLILVGDSKVGKTCLAYRLITNNFLEKISPTDKISIYKWISSASDPGNEKIRLNIWDFGRQDIYHATHRFFLTERSVYLLVWNAREKRDYDNIYYWLHTIEAFGGNSPILLVMSKMNESDDDLNLKEIKNQFPQTANYLKIDSKDGKGIPFLKEEIHDNAWQLSLTRTPWVDSWYRVREKLEKLTENWISYEDFCKICISEGLDDKNISTLDGYLHDLGITLHFKDKLENMVVLKPEWATGAFYEILSRKSFSYSEGILLYNELHQIWDPEIYPPHIYPQLMGLMNKFELVYELTDRSYLIPELLPKDAPNFTWDKRDNLCFCYCYDNFLPSAIITRFIVRMNQDIETTKSGMPLCWRKGTILKFPNSRALVIMKPNEKQIEIRIKGDNKRWTLGAICSQIDQINASIRKISVSKKIPCSCSDNCPQKYFYEDLLKAEKNKIEIIQCHRSFKNIEISLLLDGCKRREDGREEDDKFSSSSRQVIFSPTYCPTVIATSDAKQTMKAEQITSIKTDFKLGINIDLNIELPQIQNDFNNLKDELENLNPKLDGDLDKIQDNLDAVRTNSDKEKLVIPLNKLYRLLSKFGDPCSDYNKVITGTQKGIEYAQKVARTYNKFAQWLAMPQVPDIFLGR